MINAGVVAQRMKRGVVLDHINIDPYFDGTNFTASVVFMPNGSLYMADNKSGGGLVLLNQKWYSPVTNGIGSNYQLYSDFNGGSASNGGSPLGVWIDMSSNISFVWTYQSEWVGGNYVRIRNKATSEVLTTKYIMT